MNSDYEIFYFDNFIERYAIAKETAVVYFRSFGWNNSTDVDAINKSREFYKDILPLDIWTALDNSEFAFMEVSNIEETMDWLDSNFPSTQEGLPTPENYIHYSLFNAKGQIIFDNN
tara:strand:+ start:291 stop:638 length:348 start_codon:yes stop_codon:yes gene_type:complete